MCLILIAWRAHPDFPCVLAANRDEFHARPASAAHWWADKPDIVAGRDLQAGGTWLGMTRAGRLAGLTNFRDSRPRTADAPSRGGLVTALLESDASMADDLAHLDDVGPAYNGFSVIFSDGNELGVYESEVGRGRILAPGIYGLSNHLLDTPWPKVQNAKSDLASALADLSDEKSLLALLRDDRPAPENELPATGVGRDWERLLSSAFVRAADYGTRCSTVIRVDRHGGVCFDEWSWDANGAQTGRVSLRFELPRTHSGY
jgi:uncharacterized protein with NRDE domain